MCLTQASDNRYRAHRAARNGAADRLLSSLAKRRDGGDDVDAPSSRDTANHRLVTDGEGFERLFVVQRVAVLGEEARERDWRFAALLEQVRTELEDHDRMVTGERRGGPLKDGDFVAIHVELDEINACEPQLADSVIERRADGARRFWCALMDRMCPGNGRERPACEVAGGCAFSRRHERAMNERHAIGERRIERPVLAQPRHGDVSRLDRNHAALTAQPRRNRKGLRPDIRAHINDYRLGTHKPRKRPGCRSLVDAEVQRKLKALVEVEQPFHIVSRAANPADVASPVLLSTPPRKSVGCEPSPASFESSIAATAASRAVFRNTS